MKRWKKARHTVMAALAFGCLFAGPCGITTLQMQDFLTSTMTRILVQSLSAAAEAQIIAQSQPANTP